MIVIIIIAAFVLFVALCLIYATLSTDRFRVKYSELNIRNLPDEFCNVKVLHISDLHNSYFGNGNSLLAEKVKNIKPDYIFVTGDCLDRFSESGDAFIDFLKNINGKFPIYYSFGNHDVIVKNKNSSIFDDFTKKISSYGVKIVDNTFCELKRKNDRIILCAFTPIRGKNREIPPVTEKTLKEKLGDCPNDECTFLLAHEGHLFETFANWGANAVFSGHIHGGIIRIPLVGGIFGEKGSFFPKYDRGVYEKNDSVMNLSAGLGYTKFKLRFLNPPEINLLELKQKN